MHVEARHVRQRQIEQQYIAGVRVERGERLPTRAALGGYMKIGVLGDQVAEARPHEVVIVGDDEI